LAENKDKKLFLYAGLVILGFFLIGYSFKVLVVPYSNTAKIINYDSNSKSNNNFLIYQNPNNGITIRYPSDWLKLQFNHEVIMDRNNGNNNYTFPLKVGFFPTEDNEDPPDIIVENVLIGAFNNIIKSSSYSSQNISGFDKFINSQILVYKKHLSNFHVVRALGNFMFPNNDGPAYEIEYTHKEGPALLHTMQFWILNGDDVYVLLYNSDPDDYSDYIPTIQKMINSFQISNDYIRPSF
jgi:serine/threonine-protein kinase